MNENGETRRERNEAFGIGSPEVKIPPHGAYLLEWYFDLSDSLRRIRDGVAEPIPPSEFEACKHATGQIVYPSEYAILRAIDAVFCSETNKELQAYRARLDEKNAPSPAKKRRR